MWYTKPRLGSYVAMDCAQSNGQPKRLSTLDPVPKALVRRRMRPTNNSVSVLGATSPFNQTEGR